ncbi:MAG: hypothetical protein JW862_18095, partial [Anaerolineales bacterium]|nr:hypothetical protein [Anaerolineales bacterium]
GMIANNLVQGNQAQIGGGIRTVNATGLLLERNTVIGNQATNGAGGGLNLWGGFFMDVTLDGNRVFSNTASTKGGGIYIECPTGVDPIHVSNTVLAGNLAGTGSGLYAMVCDLNLAYNTIASNRAGWGDGRGLYLRDPIGGDAVYNIENTIVVDQAVGIYVESGSANLEATFWGSGSWANDANTGGAGTIDPGVQVYQGDPSFLDPLNQDYRVTETSPVIDRGVDTWMTHDLDGQPRPAGESDIGADEYMLLWSIYLPLQTR